MAEWVKAGVVGLVFALAGVLSPEWWLPWILILAAALFIWTGVKTASHAAATWTSTSLAWAKSILTGRGQYYIIAVLVIAVVLATRFLIYGTVMLQTTSLEPAFPGEDVKISGSGFPREHPKILIVRLDPKGVSGQKREATNKGVVDDDLTIALPRDLDPGDYEVVIHGPLYPLFNNAAIDLRVLGKPEITRVTPAAGFPALGAKGTKVVIRGNNFDMRNHGSANRVFFGDAVTVTRAGDEQECGGTDPSCIVAFVPGDTPDGKIVNLTVETGAVSSLGKSNPVPFQVLGPPTIDQTALAGVQGFAKTSKSPGSEITIKGQGFYPAVLDDPGAMTVVIDGKTADIVKPPSDNTVTVRIPADAKDGKIEITTRARGGSTAVGSIEILGAPEIRDWSPGTAAPDETIEIVGKNFDVSEKDNNHVAIGGARAKVTNARMSDAGPTLSATVPAFAENDEIVVETPAGRATASGIQVKPIIDNIEPKKRYIGDTLSVHGRGIFRDADASTANGVPMRRNGFKKASGEQVIDFIVPPGTETGPITIKQGTGQTAVSRDNLVIDRIGELQQRTKLVSQPVMLSTTKGIFELRASCDDGLVVTGEFSGSPVKLAVGRCPIDLDVDRATNRAYTANVQGGPKEGISEIDISDPTAPQFLQHIDSGGTNPTRVRIVHGGPIVAATKEGISAGDAKNGLVPTGIVGTVVAMAGDPKEGQFVAAILQGDQNTPGRAAVFTRDGPPKVVELPDKPKGATLAGSKIYIVNYASDNLSAFDPRSPNKLVRISLATGAKPFDLASRSVASTGVAEAYVTETGLKQIAAIDTNKDQAIEFSAPVAAPRLIAFSPEGCVAVVYDEDKREFAKIDPNSRMVFDSVQQLPQEISPPPVALRIDSTLWVSLVLSDGTIITTAYQASCPH